MTQPSLLDAAVLEPVVPRTRHGYCDALAEYFNAHRGQWIRSIDLMPIGGWCAWRTRISDLRKPPYLMVIENRTMRIKGQTYSQYRYEGPR